MTAYVSKLWQNKVTASYFSVVINIASSIKSAALQRRRKRHCSTTYISVTWQQRASLLNSTRTSFNYYYYFCFMVVFPKWTWVSRFSLGSFSSICSRTHNEPVNTVLASKLTPVKCIKMNMENDNYIIKSAIWRYGMLTNSIKSFKYLAEQFLTVVNIAGK